MIIVKKIVTEISNEKFEKILNSSKFKDKLNSNQILGELDKDKTTDKFNVDLLNVSHVIVNIFKTGTEYYANIRVLDTPNGKILKQYIEDKIVWFLNVDLYYDDILTFNISSKNIKINPIELPNGLLFYLDVVYKPNDNPIISDDNLIDMTDIRNHFYISDAIILNYGKF